MRRAPINQDARESGHTYMHVKDECILQKSQIKIINILIVSNFNPSAYKVTNLYFLEKSPKIVMNFKLSRNLVRTILKQILIYLLPIIILGNCQKNGESNSNNDEYYIKYKTDHSTIYSGYLLDVTYTDEKEKSKTVQIGHGDWEMIVGPVKQGFNANLSIGARSNHHDKLRLNVEIHSSKNSSPFAIKSDNRSETPRTFATTSWKCR